MISCRCKPRCIVKNSREITFIQQQKMLLGISHYQLQGITLFAIDKGRFSANLSCNIVVPCDKWYFLDDTSQFKQQNWIHIVTFSLLHESELFAQYHRSIKTVFHYCSFC